MERRKFLAFIPTLSAIPFIGKDIIQNEAGIHIIKPTPIIQPGISDGFDPMKVEIRLYQEGQHIANAYLTSMTLNQPIFGMRSIEFSGVVDGEMVFNRAKL